MAVLASAIINKVRDQLVDTSVPYRWSDAELMRWVSDGQRTIVAMAPSAAPQYYTLPLVAGTRQTLPATAHTLLTVLHNCSADGLTLGRAVKVAQREQLDAANPDWHTDTPSAVVRNYIFDPADPGFYVTPPNNGTGYVRVLYSQVPAEITALTDPLTVQDIYQTPLFDYVMFRAHMKDSDFAAGQGLASVYMNAFTSLMGITAEQLLQSSPNMQLTPTNLTVEGSAK